MRMSNLRCVVSVLMIGLKILPCHVQVTRGVNVRNIGQVVTERLNALRRLTVNPDDSAAMNAAYAAQQKVC